MIGGLAPLLIRGLCRLLPGGHIRWVRQLAGLLLNACVIFITCAVLPRIPPFNPARGRVARGRVKRNSRGLWYCGIACIRIACIRIACNYRSLRVSGLCPGGIPAVRPAQQIRQQGRHAPSKSGGNDKLGGPKFEHRLTEYRSACCGILYCRPPLVQCSAGLSAYFSACCG